MALQLVAAQTDPSTWSFTVTGVTAPEFVIAYGDTSAPVTVPVHASGTTVVSHTYTAPGHHAYTVTVTAAIAPYASTLATLVQYHPDESTFTNVGAPTINGQFNNEVGSRLRTTVDALVIALKFFRSVLDVTATTRPLTLWRTSDGAVMSRVSTVGEVSGSSGWTTVPLGTPLALPAGDYVVSYTAPTWAAVRPPAGQAVGSPHATFVESRIGGPGPFPPNVTTNLVYADLVVRPLTSLADLAAVPQLRTLADIPRATDTATAAVVVDVGPATIWATVIDGQPPYIQVDTWVGNPGTVTAWRIDRVSTDGVVTVWTGTTTSGGRSLVDYTAPLGVPVTYRLTVTYAGGTTSIVTSNAVTITGTTGCWLTNPATGVTLPVEIATWPERARAARQSVLEVLGRADPVALFDVHTTPAGTWTILTRTDAARDALTTLLTARAIVVLRPQPTSSIVGVTALVGDVTENRYSRAGTDQRRLFEIEIQEIAPLPGTALPLAATLGGLATYDGATLGSLSQLRPTLLQLSMIPVG